MIQDPKRATNAWLIVYVIALIIGLAGRVAGETVLAWAAIIVASLSLFLFFGAHYMGALKHVIDGEGVSLGIYWAFMTMVADAVIYPGFLNLSGFLQTDVVEFYVINNPWITVSYICPIIAGILAQRLYNWGKKSGHEKTKKGGK